jgi:type VI secretion system protein ImpG
MREELLEYYERELTYLRQMGGEFARKHPRIAGRLLLDPDTCNDPHVERLLEAFAFMAARVHRRLDDDFPQLSESLLNLVYPSYLRPVPAMTVVEMLPDPAQGKKTAGLTVPRETVLSSRQTLDGMAVRFKTSYDVALWPLRVSEAEWRQPERLQQPVRSTTGAQAVAALRLRLSCAPDVTFGGLNEPMLTKLRFYLSGDSGVVYPLYELLSANCIEIQIQEVGGAKRTLSLDPDNLKMAGFGAEENVLPVHRRSLDGHRLLQEYFTLPEKFLFFDIDGLASLVEASFGREADLILLFSRFERPERQQVLELGVNEKTLRLGCTPAINLFEQAAEPILLGQTRTDYAVVPDARQAEVMEVYSVDEVLATNPKLRETRALEPVYTYRYQTRDAKEISFWSATRKMNELGERKPSTIKISVVDLSGRLKDPDADVLTVRCSCTNFDLPSRLTFGAPNGDFEVQGYPAVKMVTALRRPTKSLDPPDGAGQLWRLVSQLSLNFLTLTEEGKGALQEVLRLHNFTDSNYWENQIRAIETVRSWPHFAMVESDFGLTPARGTAVEIELDEQQFTGGSVYLFASVLDRFFAGYASMNSFAQLTARTNLRKDPLNTWPPRAGTQTLL